MIPLRNTPFRTSKKKCPIFAIFHRVASAFYKCISLKNQIAQTSADLKSQKFSDLITPPTQYRTRKKPILKIYNFFNDEVRKCVKNLRIINGKPFIHSQPSITFVNEDLVVYIGHQLERENSCKDPFILRKSAESAFEQG